MSTLVTNIGYYGQWASSSIGLITLSTLLICHSVQQCNNKKSKKSTTSTQGGAPSFLTCSFVLLLAGILFCLSGLSEVLWTDYIAISRQICYIHFAALLSIYAVFKLILYIALCRRIIDSFGDVYTYPPKFLFAFQIALTIILFIILALCFIFIEIAVETNGEKPPCKLTRFPDILIIAIISYDFIVCIINLVLFLRPLWKLSNVGSNKEVEKKFKKLIRKNALLASISIVTSFAAWVFIAVIDGVTVFLQIIDVIVTCIAIILLFKKNEKIFIKLCCCCCYYFQKELYYEQQIESQQTDLTHLEDVELKNHIVNMTPT